MQWKSLKLIQIERFSKVTPSCLLHEKNEALKKFHQRILIEISLRHVSTFCEIVKKCYQSSLQHDLGTFDLNARFVFDPHSLPLEVKVQFF